jgi:hypothetical protein
MAFSLIDWIICSYRGQHLLPPFFSEDGSCTWNTVRCFCQSVFCFGGSFLWLSKWSFKVCICCYSFHTGLLHCHKTRNLLATSCPNQEIHKMKNRISCSVVEEKTKRTLFTIPVNPSTVKCLNFVGFEKKSWF